MLLPQGRLEGTDANPSLEQRGQQKRCPWVMGRKHASHPPSLAQVSKQIVQDRLLVQRKQATVGSQGFQFLIHARSPCRHTSAHALRTYAKEVEGSEGGGAEGEVIRERYG